MPDNHYDIIVIGSGPGGGTLAQELAPTGKRILMLERGDYLPRSRKNWDAKIVFLDGAYQAPDTWYGCNGESFHPGLRYYVGGNSKVYGSALFRRAKVTLASSGPRTASLPPGLWAMMCSNRSMPARRRCSKCMASAAKTRLSLGRAGHMPIRRSSTNRVSRS